MAFVRFEAAVQEIFAVQVLPRLRFPDVITSDERILLHSFVLPEQAAAVAPVPFAEPMPLRAAS